MYRRYDPFCGARAGLLAAYTWLENLLGVGIHNADEIHPEWQALAVGDRRRLAPPDCLGGLGREAVSRVLVSEAGRLLVVEMFGVHVLVPVDTDTTRLLVRGAASPANLMTTTLIDPRVFTMERRMLLGLKARAEGRLDSPPALTAIAHLGWIAAGLAVVALFLRRRRWLWLAMLRPRWPPSSPWASAFSAP